MGVPTIARALAQGVAAGAAGTTTLYVVTYADMAVRGRGSSELPERSVDALAQRAGVRIPGAGDTRQHRTEGVAALLGIATGLTAGVAAGLAGPVLRRLPLSLAAVAVGGLAMAGSDLPLTRLRLTDPRTWSTADWLSDAIPHLAFGAATVWTLREMASGRGEQ